MFKIAIAPYAKKLSKNKPNPKDWPFFPKLIRLLRQHIPDCIITQLGADGEELFDVNQDITGLPIKFLIKQLHEFNIIISVDSYIPHVCAAIGKQCIVLFSVTDSSIFGHSSNINLIKDKRFIAENKFDVLEKIMYDPEAFMKPDIILTLILDAKKRNDNKSSKSKKEKENEK